MSTNSFHTIDWRSKISKRDIETYNELKKQQKELVDSVENNPKAYNEEELRQIARIIKKCESEQLKIIYKYDFKRFVDEVFTNVGDASLQDKVKTPDFHEQMYNAYQMFKRVCVICPRGHAKSTTSRIYILHRILYKTTRYTVIIGSNEDMAAQNLRWVRDQLTDNPKIIEIYGELYNKSKWAETEFKTANNVKVVAKGAGQKVRGANEKGRPDLIYIDDIEDDEMVATRENREKLANWFKQAVLPIKSKEGQFIISGTVLDNDSLIKNISKNNIRDHIDWNVLFYQALNVDKDGTEYALWEEMKPLAELKRIQQVDPETFAKEFQNDPRAGVMAVFKEEWFKNCKYEPELVSKRADGTVFYGESQLSVMMHTDLAVTEREGSDFTVLMISGMDSKSNVYILEMLRFRTSDPYYVIECMFSLQKEWNPVICTMETIAFQHTFLRTLEREMESRNINISIHEMKRTNQSKLARIKALVAPIKMGKMKWREDMKEIEEEFIGVTVMKTGLHDDILDAIADAHSVQNEYMEEFEVSKYPVNSIEWLVEQGLLSDVYNQN